MIDWDAELGESERLARERAEYAAGAREWLEEPAGRVACVGGPLDGARMEPRLCSCDAATRPIRWRPDPRGGEYALAYLWRPDEEGAEP